MMANNEQSSSDISDSNMDHQEIIIKSSMAKINSSVSHFSCSTITTNTIDMRTKFRTPRGRYRSQILSPSSLPPRMFSKCSYYRQYHKCHRSSLLQQLVSSLSSPILIFIILLLYLSTIFSMISAEHKSTIAKLKFRNNEDLILRSDPGGSSSSSVNSDGLLNNQLELIFSVTENVPVGSFIGVIKSLNESVQIQPPFLIVPIPGGDVMMSPPLPPSTTKKDSRNHQQQQSSGSVDTDLNIDQSTGEIRTMVELDRERRIYYSFIAISLTGVNVHVRINIEDVNDNAPQFPTKEIELEFPENSKPRDVKRTLPPAIDLDRAIFGTQTYRIISGNVANAFRLISHREKDDILYLDLQVNGVLDRETMANYNLVIEALDGGQPPLKDQLLVKISILDHNDCEPVFSQSHYYGSVSENVTLGTSILKVLATDSDEGDNGRVVYMLHSKQSHLSSLSGSDSSSYFAINRHTGWIYVTKPLDYEAQDLHELVVIARDQGVQPLETSAFVSIRVTDINDNQPTINILFLTSNSKPEVPEDAKIGDLVARVSVNDADTHASSFLKKSSSKRYSPYNGLTVSLFGASDGEFGLRTADQIVYLIVVTGQLDRERQSKYQLTVMVSDKGHPLQNTTMTFDLEVTDVNDNVPYFDQPVYHTTLKETTDLGSSVFQMSASDRDSDSILTYAFLVPKTDASVINDDEIIYFNAFNQQNSTHQMTTKTQWFSIDRRSGLITTRSVIDCETDPEPKVTVIVCDSLMASMPTLTTTTTTTFDQYQNQTTKIGFTASATLIISISDINDNEPIFNQSFYNVSVREDAPVGHRLLQLSASDADCGLNAMVNYSLELSSPMMLMGSRTPRLLSYNHGEKLNNNHQQQHEHIQLFDHFHLDSQTGELFLQKELDYEMNTVYDLPVLATDRGGLSTTAMIKIHVIDVNDNAPIFYPREYKVSVGENFVPFQTTTSNKKQQTHPLVIVAATDHDSSRTPYGQIEYEIKTGNEKNYFDIDRRTGEIFLLKPLSALPGSSSHTQYKLTIMARDGGGMEAKEPALVLISVIPQQLNPNGRMIATPVFLQRQFNFQVIENVAQGAIVGTVRAKIESVSDESDKHYDSEEPISYAIYSGDPDGYFTIDPRLGTISVKSADIDREKNSYLLVNVHAYSGRYPGPYTYAHTQVNITILDENDNVPTFPSPTLKISVPENIPVDNGTIFVAYAIDYDAEQFGQVRYSLYPATSHDNDDRERFPFIIEERTGHVRLRKSLDYETRNEYQIRIVAIDGGQLSSEMLVHIFVQDVNDNAPIFIGTAQSIDINNNNQGKYGHYRKTSLPLYKIQVPENAPINSHIYQIKATDADTGNNARLTYSLTPFTNIDQSLIPVDIFPNNGVIYVRDSFDRENIDHYELLIFVTDHGLPRSLNATAVVHITIQDINDNRPHWKQLKYMFDIPEDASIGTFLGQVSAFDVDLDGNSTLVYNISTDSSLFRINPSTGQMYLRSNLDRELKDRYEFFVEVHDQGVPQSLYAEEKANVIVNILDINDNRPAFDDDGDNNRLTVPIGTSRKSTIATFRAFDPDAGDNGTVYYGLTEDSDLFAIDRLTGALVTKVDIKETLKRSTRKISLIAIDGQGKKSKVKLIDVEIVDKRTLNIDLDYVEQYNFNVKLQDVNYGYRLGSIDLPIKLAHHHQCNNRVFTNFHYQIKNNLPFFVESDDTNERKLYILAFDRLDSKMNEFDLLLCIDWSQCLASMLEINEIKSHHHQMIQCDHYVKINIHLDKNENPQCFPLPIENHDLFEIKIPYSSNELLKNNDLLYLNHSKCPSINNNMIQYELSSPMMNDDTLNRMFSIDSNSILQLQRPYDKTLINQYLHEDFVLSLVAKNQNKILQSVPIRVKIISSDQTKIGNIAFMNEKFVELEEDCCHVGSPIILARINISHDDFKVKYFLSGYGERQLVTIDEQFIINSDNGLLSLKREFDFERKHEHRINITAVVYDSKLPIITVSNIVKIKVLNTNDEPPVFVRRSYEKEIVENAPPGQLIVQLEAKDSDQQLIQSNITYLLPQSFRYAQYFNLNPHNGELKLAKTLDRELIEHFYVPVYAFDDDFKHHVSTLVSVKVLDINDNSPYFVYPNFDFKIPENAAPGTIIHTLIAIDPDLTSIQTNSSKSGLQYRISSGNIGSKFFLHEQRGELSINAPLDRETQSVYHLIVEVSDSFHYSTCNVTIELLDINDNAPMFDKSDYYAILNDADFGWLNVVTVRAIDSDGDKLLYLIETDSNNLTRYLSMNSETGEIVLHSSLLVPIFDQLESNVFTFEVSAIEAGKIAYQSYVSKAKVHLTLISNGNINQVHDVFKLFKYPYVIIVDESRHSIHVNQKIGYVEPLSHQSYLNLKQEKNSNLFTYRVLNGGESYRSFNNYFTIQQQTGAIIVKRPLNYNYYEAIIEVTQNFDQQGTTSTLVQIFIGGIDDRKFVQSIKLDSLEIAENQPIGSEIVNLGSFIHRRTSLSHLAYNYMIFYSDVDRSYFEIRDGQLKLKKSLDYESQPNQIKMLIFAYRPSEPNLHEHSYLYNITLHISNVDDNSPQFTQKHYIATVREGEQTGTFVAQVNAIDIDDESLIFNKTILDRRYSYYIVDGNDDNAFSIDNNGVVRTNIVLDREIHDRYQLKIIATEMKDLFGDFLADEASYQHLTQCILEVIIIDQNDNVPVFPPYKEISVSEDAEVGSVIATWTANDVDIYPTLNYMKLKTNIDTNEDEDCFDIGLFTGKIYLKCSLKPLLAGSGLLVRKIKLLLQASDQMHTIETDITVNIKRNYSKMVPIFRDGGNFYQKLNLDDDYSSLIYEINVELFRVPMIEGPILKRKIIFTLNPEAGLDGFYIDQSHGIVYNNRTIRFRSTRFVMLTIFARYQDSDVQNQASLIFNFERNVPSPNNNIGSNYYYYSSNKKDLSTFSANPSSYNLEIESSQIGVSLLRLSKRSYANYVIISGNSNKNFIILQGRELVLINRPLTDQYLLKIKPSDVKRANSSVIFVHIKVRPSTVKDSATFASPFKSQIFELEINENEKIGNEIQNLKSEMPTPRTSTTDSSDSFHFQIFSGNELNSFRVDSRTGVLIVDQKLDYETNPTYRLGVIAESHRSGTRYFAIININLINANEYCPRFPSSHFKTLIEENVSVGAKVVPIKAIDQDQNQLNYTVIKLNEWNDNPFRYDSESGYLINDGKLDYESKASSTYKFIVRAMDISSSNLYSNSIDVQCNSVETIIEVQIGSVDEHSPQFVNDSYDFKVVTTISRSRVKIGQVLAIDSDSGPDGIVMYSIKNISPQSLTELVHINSSTGIISMSIFSANLPKQFSMIVSASSGRMNSLNSLAVVNIRLTLIGDDNSEIDLSEVINNIDQGLSVVGEPAPRREAPLPGWIIFLIVLLLLITFVLMVSVIVIRLHQQQQQQHFLSGHLRTLAGGNNHVGSLFRKIGPGFVEAVGVGPSDPNIHSPAYSVAHYSTNGAVAPPAPPCYNDVTITTTSNNVCTAAPVTAEGHSASSGRGSAEDDADLDDVDEEIRMINESSNYYIEDQSEEVTTISEYLARLGVTNHYEEEPENTSSVAIDDDDESIDVLSQISKIGPSRYSTMKKSRLRGPSVISGSNHSTTTNASVTASGNRLVQPGEPLPQPPTIHNEEELSGSYNWDYLQHYQPKYQPLSSVFAEIARLKSADGLAMEAPINNNVTSQVNNAPQDIIENMSQRSTSSSSKIRQNKSCLQEQQAGPSGSNMIYGHHHNPYVLINQQPQQDLNNPYYSSAGNDGEEYGTVMTHNSKNTNNIQHKSSSNISSSTTNSLASLPSSSSSSSSSSIYNNNNNNVKNGISNPSRLR